MEMFEGKGNLDSAGLRAVLSTCMEECKLHLSSDALDELTDSLMEEAGGNDVITYAQLEEVLKMRGFNDRVLSSSMKQTPQNVVRPHSRWTSREFWRNNLWLMMFALGYLAINAGLFYYYAMKKFTKFPDYKTMNSVLCNGTKGILSFNLSLIALTMQRQLMSWIRRTRISYYLPLDRYLIFHIVVGITIIVAGYVHGGAFIYKFAKLSTDPMMGPYDWKDWLFSTKLDIGYFHGSTCITGWILLGFYGLIGFGALPCIRKSGRFEIFYYTHLLVIPAWIVLIFHAKEFWMWIVGPGAVYVISWLMRSRIAARWRYGMVDVTEVVLLPSNVTHLVFKRPSNFKFRPGDYVYVNIPSIARDEWHPFTLSSAPEHESLWMHVRVLGNWTKKLRKSCEMKMIKGHVQDDRESLQNRVDGSRDHKQHVYTVADKHMSYNGYSNSGFQDTETNIVMNSGKTVIDIDNNNVVVNHHNEKGQNGKMHQDSSQSQNFDHVRDSRTRKKLQSFHKPVFRAYLDGPYGEAASHMSKAEHAVLIAAGVGVTPFASLLQSLWFHYKDACKTCTANPKFPQTMKKLKRVDFFWINRHQQSFEWFVDLLSQLEIEQSEMTGNTDDFLRFHMYVTSAARGDRFKSLLLQLALELSHKKENRDHILGLKTRTHAGRPDWDQVFKDLSTQKKGRVTIFYVGPPAIQSILQTHCMKYNFGFRSEPN